MDRFSIHVRQRQATSAPRIIRIVLNDLAVCCRIDNRINLQPIVCGFIIGVLCDVVLPVP